MDAVPRPEPPARPLPLPVPLSFGGVASVASRTAWCLLAWQITVALLVGTAVAWSFDLTWGRAFEHAVKSLPDQAAIRDGRLDWPSSERSILHQGPFLGLVVDPRGLRESSLASDVTLSIEPDGVSFRSLLGWASLPYPQHLRVPLSRLEMAGTLSAWETPAFLAIAGATAGGLLLSWWLLAFAYGAILWGCAGILGRKPGFGTVWRTAGAALLAPALLMTAALLLYATRNLTFVGFLLALPLHLIAGWLYCAGGLTSLPVPGPASANPFGDDPPRPVAPVATAVDSNPFRPS